MSPRRLYVAWAGILAIIIVMWLVPTVQELSEYYGFGELLHGIGLLFGLLAVYFALTYVLLIAGIGWVTRAFDQHQIARYQKIIGISALLTILLHPFLIVLSHSIIEDSSYANEYMETLSEYAFTPLAQVAQVLFVIVAVLTVSFIRARLKPVVCTFVAVALCLAILLGFFHQTVVGDTFIGRPLNIIFWYVLYGFVGLNLIYYRIVVPLRARHPHSV